MKNIVYMNEYKKPPIKDEWFQLHI